MTERDKQIAEMAKLACSVFDGNCMGCSFAVYPPCPPKASAERLYNAGYRKQVKGEWETRKGERWIGSEVCEKYEYYACSRCGKRHDRSRDPYCPNCGANMKGGESDDRN